MTGGTVVRVSQVKVSLGDHEYVVHPQRHAYLRHRLGKEIGNLAEVDLAQEGDENLLDQVIQKSYEFLSVFIPDIMPRWEYEGYGSPSSFQSHEYDEAADKSPSPDQIIGAFEAALRVNRLDLVKHLKAWVGEDYLRAQIQVMIGEMTTRALDSSATSASANGESDSTSSGMSDPTPPLPSLPELDSVSPTSESASSLTPGSVDPVPTR